MMSTDFDQNRAIAQSRVVAIAEAAVSKIYDAITVNESTLERLQEAAEGIDPAKHRQNIETIKVRWSDGLDDAINNLEAEFENFKDELRDAKYEYERLEAIACEAAEKEEACNDGGDADGESPSYIADQATEEARDAEISAWCIEYAIDILEDALHDLGDEDDEESEIYAARIVVKTIWDF